MTPFEKGSGINAGSLHLLFVGVSGTIFIIAAIVILISLIHQLHDSDIKFNHWHIIKMVVLCAIVSIIIGIIASM